MPKIKTHRGAAKRFSLTKGGKVKRAKAGRRHILNKKTEHLCDAPSKDLLLLFKICNQNA